MFGRVPSDSTMFSELNSKYQKHKQMLLLEGRYRILEFPVTFWILDFLVTTQAYCKCSYSISNMNTTMRPKRKAASTLAMSLRIFPRIISLFHEPKLDAFLQRTVAQ